jgi:hypothetical protein
VPGSVAGAAVVLLDHGKALEVALDAGREVIVSVALDDRELFLPAPAGTHLPGIRSDRRHKTGPLGPNHDQNRSHEKHDRNDPHA